MLLLLGAVFACFRFAFFAYFETRARTFSSGVVVMFAMGNRFRTADLESELGPKIINQNCKKAHTLEPLPRERSN